MRLLRKVTLTAALLSSMCVSAQAHRYADAPGNKSTGDQTIEGYWEGIIAHHGTELRINVEFWKSQDGLAATIDIPDLYILGYKLTKVTADSAKVHFELPLSSQPDVFDGAFTNQNIEGKFSGRFYAEAVTTAVFRLWRERRDTLRYRSADLSFSSGAARLAGTLFMPRGSGRHPAIILLHGSGPQTRESYLRFFADLFAQRGIATLIYDKRGTGESTGEIWYRTGDNFDQLVTDALAGAQMLRGRSDIDPGKIGLWGLSQGGWLAPMAASRDKDIAFLVVVSGGGVTPAEQELFDDEVNLRDRGFSAAQIGKALDLLRLADNVIRKQEPLEKFVVAREAAQKEPWFAYLDRYPVKLPKEDPIWRSPSTQMDLDPRPFWERLKRPALAIFGEQDKSTPARESANRIDWAMKKGGNHQYRIRIFPSADHGLWVIPSNESSEWRRPAPEWLDLMVSWVHQRIR